MIPKIPTCHPQAKYYASGMCMPCYSRARHASNPEHIRATQRRHYANNRENILTGMAQDYATNPEPKRDRARQWAKANPERVAALARQGKLRRKFGITPEEYNQFAKQQGGVCAICKQVCSTGMRLAVDHDHETGKVRGLLCRACNRALGGFEHDPVRLRKAANYLELIKLS